MFSKLFGRGDGAAKTEQKRAQAIAGWEAAMATGNEDAMQAAIHQLAEAEARIEQVEALTEMVRRFPNNATQYENDIGVYYYFEQKYDLALEHYARSYALDEPGCAAQSNILEVCKELAQRADTDEDEVRALMRYFRVCTRQIDPSATFEEIDLLSIVRSNPKSLADDHRGQAQELLEQIEDILSDTQNQAFVAETNQELDHVAAQWRLQRDDSAYVQQY